MIMIDNRAGSKELFPLFPPGDAKLTCLPYADFSFTGKGPDEVPWLIGIERKTIRDLLNSMSSGRLAGHQLIGLVNSYNTVYLIVEGLFRPKPNNGLLQIWQDRNWITLSQGNRNYMLRDVWLFLSTLTIKTGIHCIMTHTEYETVHYTTSLYWWWTRKEYNEHRSYLQPHNGDIAPMTSHSLVRRVAAQLKGVGWERAKAIANEFSSVEEMVECNEDGWVFINGIGAKLAKSITQELREKM